VLNPPAGFDPPHPPASSNSWNLIDTRTPAADYNQYIYWHVISATEALSVPSFAFSFTASGSPTTVRSTGVAIVYQNTCTQSTPTPCVSGTPIGNPIADMTTGTATGVGTVTQTADLNVLADSIATCAFGTSNTSVGFTTAPTSPTTLNLENGNSGINGGLTVFDRFETGTPNTDGAWMATLPASGTGDNAAQCVNLIPIGF
jgi:hypothetical protein